MATDAQRTDWSEGCLREAEASITHQQKLAERLEVLGYKQQARQAREMLAVFVKSYLTMHDCHRTMENRSFSALAKTWLSFAIELDKPKASLDALGELPVIEHRKCKSELPLTQ